MPGALDEALDALEADHQFLLKGDVFTEELLETYVQYKREKEVNAIRIRLNLLCITTSKGSEILRFG